MIGCWGLGLIFTTSDFRVLTFNDFNRSISSDWATHSRMGLKDQSEYLRPGLQTITFTITLDATLGVSPRILMERIAHWVEAGTLQVLIIGLRRVGDHRWKIKSCSEAWDIILRGGQIAQAKLNLTLEEYL
jgi:hypothetical protein